MVATRLLTAEDLDAMGPEAEKRFEIVDGVLVAADGVGGRRGAMSVDLMTELHNHIGPRRLGELFSAGTRFILRRDPDLVLMADVTFIRAERIPTEGVWENSVPIPPDLTAHIVSPDDTSTELRRKATRFLEAGVRLVWIVWPKRREVSVLRPGQPELVLGERDELDGGDVIPGFRLPVAAIFR